MLVSVSQKPWQSPGPVHVAPAARRAVQMPPTQRPSRHCWNVVQAPPKGRRGWHMQLSEMPSELVAGVASGKVLNGQAKLVFAPRREQGVGPVATVGPPHLPVAALAVANKHQPKQPSPVVPGWR